MTSWTVACQASWNSPGQNTGAGSPSLLQGIFPTQGSNPDLPHRRQILYQLTQGKPKNTGLGSLSLLQKIFPTQELNQGLPHCRRILYQLSYEVSENKSIHFCCHPNSLTPWLVASLRPPALGCPVAHSLHCPISASVSPPIIITKAEQSALSDLTRTCSDALLTL